MKKALLIFFVIGLSSQCLFAQELKSTQNKFGLGVSLFNLSEYLNESSLGNTIYLTINTKNNFRIEPTIGFSLAKNRSKYELGLGVFKQKDLSNFNLSAGIRLGISDGSTFIIAPTLGGEYYFNEHFSIGSEIQLRGTFEREDFMIFTNTMVLVRFYF